jgi:hypothetical protein
MNLFRLITILLAATLLAACGGNAAENTPTPPAETTASSENSLEPEAASTDDGDIKTEAAAASADTLPAATLTELDPEQLEPGSFQVEVINREVVILLEPREAQTETDDQIFAQHSLPVDYMPFHTISFTWHRRVGEATYSSQVRLQLPADLAPGTYEIETSAMMMEEGKVGAYVDAFTDNVDPYYFYEEFEGTITITAVEGEAVSGTFDFIGRTQEGWESHVVGVFNQITTA